MSGATWIRSATVFLLAAALSGVPAAEAQEKPAEAAWEKVVYRGDAGIPGLELVRTVALTSPTSVEILEAGSDAPRRGSWSLSPGPTLRCVLAGVEDATSKVVESFRLDWDGVQMAWWADGPRLSAAEGVAWHRRRLADAKLAAEPGEFATAERARLVVYGDGNADICMAAGEAQAPAAAAHPKPDVLVLTLPGGAKRTLRRDGGAWVDGETEERFDDVRESDRQRICRGRLAQIAGMFVAESVERPGKPKYDGVALLLSWRQRGRMIPAGREWILRCPGDRGLARMDDAVRKAYDDVDLRNPRTDLCSYASRDFTQYPLRPEAPDRQIVFCCRQGTDGRTPHHDGGICVAYDDGSTRFLTPEKLGLARDDPIVVGPDSKSPLLKMMCQVPKR